MKLRALLRRAALLPFAITGLRLAAANTAPTWQPPATAGVTLIAQPDGKVQITSTADEFVVDSVASLPAKGGDAFAVDVRVRVGVDMSAQPELACFDAQGRAVPPPVPVQAMRQSSTQWQRYTKTFIAWPGTVTVRARLRDYGRGTEGVGDNAHQLKLLTFLRCPVSQRHG